MTAPFVPASFLVFTRGFRSFALTLEQLVAVCPSPLIQRVWPARPSVVGVFAHHGHLVALIEPPVEREQQSVETAIAIVARCEQGELAFAADHVEGVFARADDSEILNTSSEYTRILTSHR